MSIEGRQDKYPDKDCRRKTRQDKSPDKDCTRKTRQVP